MTIHYVSIDLTRVKTMWLREDNLRFKHPGLNKKNREEQPANPLANETVDVN